MYQYADNLFNTIFLEDFIMSFNGTAHLKDLNSGKYILSNEANIKKVGLANIDAIVGLTVHDLHQHMQGCWGSDMALQISELDNRLKINPNVLIDQNRAYLNSEQYVFVHNLKNYPIVNSRNQISSVLTINEVVTPQVSY